MAIEFDIDKGIWECERLSYTDKKWESQEYYYEGRSFRQAVRAYRLAKRVIEQ